MGDVRGPGGQPEPKLPALLGSAPRNRSPNLADPTEFATLAPFPLEARPGRCTQFPTGALADLGPTDTPAPCRSAPATRSASPRVLRTSGLEDSYPSEVADCLSRPANYVDRFIPVADRARPLDVYLAVGRSASVTTREEAFAIVDPARRGRATSLSHSIGLTRAVLRVR